MTRFTKLMLTAFLGGTALSGAAYAAQDQASPPPAGAHHRHRPHGMMMFDKIDANHDGVVTKDEALAAADFHFNQLDANRDGKIDQTEVQGRHAAMLRHLDADGDGVVTKAEAENGAMKQFDRFDTNHDGRIDQSEIAAAKGRMAARRAKREARHAAANDQTPAPSDDQ